jgi:hypothetical protein
MASILDLAREKFDSEDMEFEWKYLYWVLFPAVFFFALWVRFLPANGMQYLQALDSYMIARMSAAIVQNGHLPAVDPLRYFPFTTPTYLLNLGNIYIPAYLYSIARVFGMSFQAWAQFYPALMGALAVVPVYLMGAEVFDRKTGLLSAFFLSSSVAIMHRSSAGWFEKEPVANFLMLSSMYLFIRAWKRKSWWSGIGSGLCLGFAATSWGGAQFLYLLYPIFVGVVVIGFPTLAIVPSLLLERDMSSLDIHENILVAYLPTALLAPGVAFIFNGEAIGFLEYGFLLNAGLAGFVWLRYYIEEFEWVEERYLPYTSTGLAVIGLFALALSPLYSQPLWGYVQRAISKVSQSSVGVVGATVAENTPANMNQIISQLGASSGASIIPAAQPFMEYLSGWTFGLIGFAVLSAYMFLAFLKQYLGVDEFEYSTLLGTVPLALGGICAGVYMMLGAGNPVGFIPALTVVGLGTTALFLAEYLLRDQVETWTASLSLIWAFVLVIGVGFLVFNRQFRVAFGFMIFWNVVLGLLLVGLRFTAFREGILTKTVTVDWTRTLFFLWIGGTLYGATQKSRLLFLTAAPVAMVAGIGLAKGLEEVSDRFVWHDIFDTEMETARWAAPRILIVFIVLAVVVVNGAAVYAMGTQGVSGSPNSAWMENMDHLREETEKGSVLLSWWDYGYWFQTIGGRASVADGGNYGFYGGALEDVGKINTPLARFLSSENASEWRDWLSKYSVDHIILDRSMIGKYSAVTQIANRDNQDYNSMQILNCQRRGNQCMASQNGDSLIVRYNVRFGDYLAVPVPLGSGVPKLVVQGREIPIANVCLPGEGIVQMTEDPGTTGKMFVTDPEKRRKGAQSALEKAVRSQRPFGGCVAYDPASLRGGQFSSSVVLVPPAVMGETLPRLYLMDGAGIDFAGETKEFGDGYVKMWSVEE